MPAEEILSSMDLLDQLKSKKAGQAPAQKRVHKRESFLKVLDEIKDFQVRTALENIAKKELQSPDLASLRLVSLASRAAELRNEMTIFLNILESNAYERVTDFQVRFRERRIGQDAAVMFNPNGSLPAEALMNRPMRTNTLGFIGNTLKIRFIAQELGQQSPVQATDPRAEEIDFELTRIRRGMNSKLLSNTEVTAENAGFVPQPGGFITRSTSYGVATSGDATNTLIQGRVNAIANVSNPEGLGYRSLVAMGGGPTQLQKVRDLMIARYPGENSEAYFASTAEIRRRLANVNVPEDQMVPYLPMPGRPILFVYEPQMDTDKIIFFDPMQPQLGKFQMFGGLGPWILERPTADILYLLLVFDSFTLLDHLIESRAVVSGMNP